MGVMSYVFFGLLVLPLALFIGWMIKQDRRRNLLGIVLLIIGILIASYTIVRLDKSFVQNNKQIAPKASSFR